MAAINCTCLDKYRDKNNKIYGYKLVDKKGKIINIYTDALKDHIREGRVKVSNLTLTSDNRLVDTTISEEKQSKIDEIDNKITNVLTKATLLGQNTTELLTPCGHKCFLIETGKNKFTLYIPDDVVTLVSNIKNSYYYRYTMGDDPTYDYKIHKLLDCSIIDRSNLSTEKELTVIGGLGLKDAKFMAYYMKLKRLDLTKFNTPNLENMEGMFSQSIIENLVLGGDFNTSNVTNMKELFCNSIIGRHNENGKYMLKTTDISGLDTSKVVTMENMFCSATIKFNVEHLNFKNVNNTVDMFRYYNVRGLDISKIDYSNIKFMNNMFRGAYLEDAKLVCKNIRSDAIMIGMFGNSTIQNLDLTEFGLGQVKYLGEMFASANIKNLNLRGITLRKDANIKDIFSEFKGNIAYSDEKLKKASLGRYARPY